MGYVLCCDIPTTNQHKVLPSTVSDEGLTHAAHVFTMTDIDARKIFANTTNAKHQISSRCGEFHHDDQPLFALSFGWFTYISNKRETNFLKGTYDEPACNNVTTKSYPVCMVDGVVSKFHTNLWISIDVRRTPIYHAWYKHRIAFLHSNLLIFA